MPETQPPPTDEELLLGYLQQREAVCPVCKYNLHALTLPRCPECGMGLRLSVGTVEPYLRAWILLIVAACASAGLGVLFVVVVVRDGWPLTTFSGRTSILEFVATNGSIAYFMATIPVVVLALAFRRWFIRRARATQWAFSALFSIVSILVFLAFCYYIR